MVIKASLVFKKKLKLMLNIYIIFKKMFSYAPYD